MGKILIGLGAAALVVSPALAQRGGGRGGFHGGGGFRGSSAGTFRGGGYRPAYRGGYGYGYRGWGGYRPYYGGFGFGYGSGFALGLIGGYGLGSYPYGYADPDYYYGAPYAAAPFAYAPPAAYVDPDDYDDTPPDADAPPPPSDRSAYAGRPTGTDEEEHCPLIWDKATNRYEPHCEKAGAPARP